ncbi:MAG: hypothetical protein K1X81_11860 [Bacteroidia bacterium]|nr:hypothetical protein [Bacteroidia bacterium]
MHQIKLLLLLTSFCCLSLHCKKEEVQKEVDKLPPISAEGKQTFGCLINGKAWPNASIYQFSAWGENGRFELNFYTRYSSGSIMSGPNIIDEMIISIKSGIDGPGHYLVPFNSGWQNVNFTMDYKNVLYRSSITPSSYATLDIIRLDTVNHIVAGTFEFTLFDEIEWKSLKVTKGRFDCRWG